MRLGGLAVYGIGGGEGQMRETETTWDKPKSQCVIKGERSDLIQSHPARER